MLYKNENASYKEETKLYKFIDKEIISEFSGYDRITTTGYIYANKVDVMKEFKELVVEEKPKYDEETQELYSWYEDGEVITQKFKVVDKRGD